MTTITLEKPRAFRVDSAAAPTGALANGEALVRVHRVGLCGTDWHAYHGRQPFFTYPRVLGHELGVEVLAVADDVKSVRPGDRCCVEPYLNCGTCIACRRGRGNCCENMRVLGVHQDGGMRERLVLPAAKLHRSDSLSFDQLALVETLAIGCHAVARAQVERGENVLVLGAGPIGLSVIPFAKATGARVTVADVSPSRLTFAQEQMHADLTVDAQAEDLPATLRAAMAGQLPTCVIDATGNPQSMARAFELPAHGGRLVFVGLFQGDVAFNDPNFHRRELALLASRNALPDDFKRIIRLAEEGVIDTRPWITHRCPASAFITTLPAWLDPRAGVLKAVIEF